MAGEPNTAEKQNEIRREQKRKHRTGKKKGFGRQDVSASEKMRLPRVVNAVFTGETQAAVDQHIMDRPELPLTTNFFKKILKRGDPIEFKVNDDKFPTMDGETFRVDKEGFDTPIFVHTVRFWTGMGFGIEVKKLPNGFVIVD